MNLKKNYQNFLLTFHFGIDAQDPVRTLVHEDSLDTFSSCAGTNAALLYITLSWLAARAGDSSAPENFESSFYLQSSVSAINKELENADECGLSEGTIAAVACMTNMEVRKGSLPTLDVGTNRR